MSDVQAAAETTAHPHTDLLVEIDHVVFGYDGGRTILNDVSLSFGRGKVTAILGGSGCGKTTLLRLMGGVYPVDKGAVRFDGQVVDARNAEQLFALRRRLGMLFQFGALFTDLSVFDNVAFPLREHTDLDETMIRDIVLMKLNAVGLRGAARCASPRSRAAWRAASRWRARSRSTPSSSCTTSRSPASTRSRWRSPPT